METVVIIIMLAVALTFLLKLTCHRPVACIAISAVAALFTFLCQEVAITQSKAQIADWLADPTLMLDTSVLLTVDVMLQIAFCFLMMRRVSGEKLSRPLQVAFFVTYWFPGLLIFPVLFSLLVEMIFAMPGVDFSTVTWITAGSVLVAMPALAWLLKWLLPEPESRLELMFLVSILTAALGIVATVNGRTASAGTTQVEWSALAAVLGLLLAGTIVGYLWKKLKPTRI